MRNYLTVGALREAINDLPADTRVFINPEVTAVDVQGYSEQQATAVTTFKHIIYDAKSLVGNKHRIVEISATFSGSFMTGNPGVLLT